MGNYCQNGLTWKQHALLRDYLNSREPMDTILKARDINPTRFQKWLHEDPLFRHHYIETRRLRALIQETNPTTEPGSLDHHLNAQADQAPPSQPHTPPPTGSSAACGLAGPQHSQSKPAHPRQPPISEREWLYSLNGEQGVKAYDRLVALHQQLEVQAPPADPGGPTSVEHVSTHEPQSLPQEAVSGSTERALAQTDDSDQSNS